MPVPSDSADKFMDTKSNPRIVLAGGTGFLGKRLQRALSSAGYEVTVLTRRPETVAAPARGVAWNPQIFGTWTKELDGAYAVINLAGRNVNCRHTKANRTEIRKSRINSVRALAEAIRRCAAPPEVWVQAGSLAIHGDAGPLWCDESAPAGTGFGTEVCRQWEDTFFKTPLPGTVRRVMLRIGLVLGNHGGTLPVLAGLAKFFAGAPAGKGKQFVSWLHAHDMDRIFLHALTESNLSGVVQACTAGAVTNAEFMAELRSLYRRPWMPPLPSLLVKAAAWCLNSHGSLALTGCRGLPGRLMETGFRFDYPALGPALDELLLGPRVPTPVPAPIALPARPG